MLRNPPAVHALLRAAHTDALVFEAQRPPWAAAALQRAPWVVVRRAAAPLGLSPVGVRGSLRAQRSAAWLAQATIQECITPQVLAARRAWRQRSGPFATPALAVLDRVAEIFVAHGLTGRWGPGGSVGFELASGVPCTHPGSDLDLVLSADEPMARADALRLHADLLQLPVRIDLLLETPHGAAVLAEYVRAAGEMLLRTSLGPRLVLDSWDTSSAVGAG
jgi:phosphoribosyl-dephospho-CoA transferase